MESHVEAPRRHSVKEPTETDLFVGQQIRHQRMRAKKSQSDIARCLGITFQQVQKYEKGTNRISPGKLAALAALFGIKVEEFFPSPPEPSEQSVVRNEDAVRMLGQTSLGHRLAIAFLQMTVQQRHAAVRMLETIVEPPTIIEADDE